jgi:hypothetical protein
MIRNRDQGYRTGEGVGGGLLPRPGPGRSFGKMQVEGRESGLFLGHTFRVFLRNLQSCIARKHGRMICKMTCYPYTGCITA